MSDATFTAISPPTRGATPSAPIVFSARIGGSDLAWGRGKTRDIAIDNACRAAFALVAAHGYTDFECNEDCLTVEPTELMNPNATANGNNNGNGVIPPPPLPPVLNGVPPLPPGVPPPLPHGMPNVPMPMNGTMPIPPPGVPPPMMGVPPPIGIPPPPIGPNGVPLPVPPNKVQVSAGVMLIPQAKSLSSAVAVPSVISKDGDSSNQNLSSNGDGKGGGVDGSGTGAGAGAGQSEAAKTPLSLSLDPKEKSKKSSGTDTTAKETTPNGNGTSTGTGTTSYRKKIKGGFTLLYDPEADGNGTVVTMEMRRAKLSKYRMVLKACRQKRAAVV